jgi:hypothetical protein
MEVLAYIHPINQTPELDDLVAEFGPRLQKLTREDKLGLRALLLTYNHLIETTDEWALLGSVLEEPPVQPSEALDQAIAILEEVDPDSAEGLIEALTAQLRCVYARLGGQ